MWTSLQNWKTTEKREERKRKRVIELLNPSKFILI
jgi:hypothetical protein